MKFTVSSDRRTDHDSMLVAEIDTEFNSFTLTLEGRRYTFNIEQMQSLMGNVRDKLYKIKPFDAPNAAQAFNQLMFQDAFRGMEVVGVYKEKDGDSYLVAVRTPKGVEIAVGTWEQYYGLVDLMWKEATHQA